MSQNDLLEEGQLLLKRTVTAVHSFSDEEWEIFLQPWRLRQADRKQTLTVAGSREQYLYFVVQGVQRVFYLDEQEREATLLFTYAPSFGGIVDAYLQQTSSAYYYETLTHSVLLQLPFADMERLLQTVPSMEAFVRKALTASLAGILHRMVELQCFSSEEKFRQLLRRSPQVLQLVPHKYLANYIGMNATNFSKLINSIRI